MYDLKTIEEIVETFVKEDAPQWVKDYVRNFIKEAFNQVTNIQKP